MTDFLAENNICGQTILQLVSRGNAIIAELLRLKEYIPKCFYLSTKTDIQKYGDIIMDFNYFKIEDAQNHKIENSETLLDLDEELKENNIEIITRFYLTFESIHIYITDLNNFLEELEEGFYIHQTLESVFTDMEGKQLLCEALYLYGLMLLILDAYIEGPIRERLLIAYYRYLPQRSDTQSRIDEVCKLLRDTGFHSGKKPSNYPEDYFRRVQIKSTYVDVVIGHLRTDDIYGQLAVYPLPKHRSTALAQQASMLYVCLFFSSNILHSQTAIMREIVDKYFPDNWVISIYMGLIVNLAETWEPFKAAKLALNNTVETINIKEYATNYSASVDELLSATKIKLTEGNITKDNLLKDVNNIINLLRDCNCTVRWLMLHTSIKPGRIDKNKRAKQLRELVFSECQSEINLNLFKLLLNTAQLELITRDIYKNLLVDKNEQWNFLKDESYKSLVELSEVFSGAKPLTRVPRNPKLEQWFLEISKQVQSLDHDDGGSSRKIVQLIQALEEVQEFHQLESNMQIMQFLLETRKYLHQMFRNMNIKEDVLITLQIIGDLTYAWELIDLFTPIMQKGIKEEPILVTELRAVFLKLASALEVPLLRINQAHSEDLVSVSQYFSRELEVYIRKVLQIIPSMMFEKMSRIIKMQTTTFKELPTRLEKDKLKEYAQLDQRFEFAELTHSIALFGQGMRMMKSTLVGVICLDPKQLLEDGIRKELVHCIAKALHETLIFSSKSKNDTLDFKLKSLGNVMDGYKRSFEYIQDYININGLLIWQQEVSRIINYNVEQECNKFIRNKVQSWQSEYQDRHVPIPCYSSIDNVSENFIGRLAREIIRTTDPRQTVYIEQMSSWYDSKSRKAVFNKESIASLVSAIEIPGLIGLDKFFSFMIVLNLQKISSCLQNKQSNSWKNIISSVEQEIKSPEHILTVQNPIKFYQNCINRTTKIWSEFLESVLIIGQMQILRKLIAFHLSKTSKFTAKCLESSLRALNDALLIDIENDRGPNEELLSKISTYFNYVGLYNPYNKIYITSKFKETHAITLFIFVLAHSNKFFYPRPATGNASRKSSENIDGISFAVGLHTIIKQFHPKLNIAFIKYLSNYIKSFIPCRNSVKLNDFPSEIELTLTFLEKYVNYSDFSRKIRKETLSDELVHILHILLAPI